jgi:RNA-directed DNA polymerase
MLERATDMSRREKSAKTVVAEVGRGGRRPERRVQREGQSRDGPLGKAMHQMSGRPEVLAKRDGEAAARARHDEAELARDAQTDCGATDLLGQALARENMAKAWIRVKANKGGAGVDGRTVQETAVYLKSAWPHIRERLLDGSYWPMAVRRVSIPKPGGGERELGIPTVVDRLVQQALLQVLQPIIDPGFSDHSHGFRPGRGAHGAVLKAQQYVQAGHEMVVDVDLERFFDCVNHDILMERLAKRVADKRVLGLIRRYLQAGILVHGAIVKQEVGTPQGGPLSPILANVLLDEVDRELERRGHRFVRYADDCNVYVKSLRAGHRVLQALRRCYARLSLKVNEAKTAVAPVWGRKFLGYCLHRGPQGQVKLAVSVQALVKARVRLREITKRNRGRSMDWIVRELQVYVRGWRAYFRLTQEPMALDALDQRLRRRLRAVQLKQWKTWSRTYQMLRQLGASMQLATAVARNVGSWWRSSLYVGRVLTNGYFDRLGVPKFS